MISSFQPVNFLRQSLPQQAPHFAGRPRTRQASEDTFESDTFEEREMGARGSDGFLDDAQEPTDADLKGEEGEADQIAVLDDEAESTEEGPAAEKDLIKLYLKEIAQYPILTREQETEIGKKLEAGREKIEKATQALKQHDSGKKPLTPDEKIEMERMLAEGRPVFQQARNTLINHNLRLVVGFAKRYKHPHLSLGDNIQNGTEGLMRAAEKFDYTRGFKFSTYAVWWIRQSMRRAVIDEGSTIRLPANMVEKIKRFRETEAVLTEKLGRPPSPEEIAAELGIGAAMAHNIYYAPSEPVSLETPVGDEDGPGELQDFISDEAQAHRQEVFSDCIDLERALSTLSERERTIIRRRFFDDEQLETVGETFGVTRERIRQQEATGIQKLRRQLNPGAPPVQGKDKALPKRLSDTETMLSILSKLRDSVDCSLDRLGAVLFPAKEPLAPQAQTLLTVIDARLSRREKSVLEQLVQVRQALRLVSEEGGTQRSASTGQQTDSITLRAFKAGIKTLSELHQYILRERLGLNETGQPKTSEEIALLVGKTPSAVTDNGKKAMSKLRRFMGPLNV